jgi:hypothetical protein
MERDELLALRPLIPIANFDDTSMIERFQNDTIRPVIKMQHELLIGMFKAHPLVKNSMKPKGPRLEFQKKVRELISGQSALKSQFTGIIIGMLTSQEFEFYLLNQSELNKRIHSMVCQRIADSLY